MEFTCVDEIIIDFVRDNKCLYDKSDLNFKNIMQKKDIWSKISENVKNLYHMDMSAETIEKRWSSLRDMFVRENRKQKLPPSGSEYKPVKEWELYRNMMFLLPHIAHRRTKSSYIPLNQSTCSLSKTSSPKVNNLLPLKEAVNVVQSLPSCDHNYSQPKNEFVEDNEQLINEDTVITIDYEPVKRPASAMSTCSSTSSNIQSSEASTSTSSKKFRSLPIFQSIKKIVPKMDKFAQHRKNKDDQIDRDLAEASSVISTAVKTISSQLCDEKRKTDGYMTALEEGLNYVPAKNKTQCLIEVLQIIQKYEER